MSRRCVTHPRQVVQNTPAARTSRHRSRSAPFKPLSTPSSPAPGHAVLRCAARRATAGALDPTTALTHLPAGPSAARRRPAGLAAAGAASDARVHTRRRVSWAGRETRNIGCCTRWACLAQHERADRQLVVTSPDYTCPAAPGRRPAPEHRFASLQQRFRGHFRCAARRPPSTKWVLCAARRGHGGYHGREARPVGKSNRTDRSWTSISGLVRVLCQKTQNTWLGGKRLDVPVKKKNNPVRRPVRSQVVKNS